MAAIVGMMAGAQDYEEGAHEMTGTAIPERGPRYPRPSGARSQALDPEREAIAAKLRAERTARKLENQRRRLPKGHPDRLEGPA